MKGTTHLRSQPYTAEAILQPVTTAIPGRDLVSIRDLSPIEVESLFQAD